MQSRHGSFRDEVTHAMSQQAGETRRGSFGSDGPFAKTGERRQAPKPNVVKPTDKAAAMRQNKLAALEAAAASVNISTRAAAADYDGSGFVDTGEYATHLKAQRGVMDSTLQKRTNRSSGYGSHVSSAGARRRPAVSPPARATEHIPRYFETTVTGDFRQYTVREMVQCTPWCAPNHAAARARSASRPAFLRWLVRRARACVASEALTAVDAPHFSPCARRKDKRDGKGDRFDENELREKWHTDQPGWDYTVSCAKHRPHILHACCLPTIACSACFWCRLGPSVLSHAACACESLCSS